MMRKQRSAGDIATTVAATVIVGPWALLFFLVNPVAWLLLIGSLFTKGANK